jgi:hypothetical protein
MAADRTPIRGHQHDALKAATLYGSDTLGRARALLFLVQWIEKARSVVDSLEGILQGDRGLSAQLQDKGLRLAFPMWEEDESSGMQWLLLHIGDDLVGGVEQQLDDARNRVA